MGTRGRHVAGLKAVIVHHHARPGGVATVMLRHARALLAAGHKVILATGEGVPTGGQWDGIPRRVLPALHYRAARLDETTLAATASDLRAMADGGVLHIHNPYLGKNASWPDLWLRLAAAGPPMVFHVHDFAEDARDAMLAAFPDRSLWYPVAGHLAWLVLNRRDAEILKLAGVPPGCLDILENPVAPPAMPPGPAAPGLFWYPARALARKNIGEFLLLAALAAPGRRFLLTTPATAAAHPPELTYWLALAASLDLPVRHVPGLPAERPARALTTSRQEGFGFAFAEPWLAGIPVCGRCLPEATSALTGAGLRFPSGYLALRDPETRADFADLPVGRQAAIIRRARHDPPWAARFAFDSSGGQSLSSAEWFARVLAEDPLTLAHNQLCLSQSFSPGAVAAKLAHVYRRVLAAPHGPHGHADAAMVASLFQSRRPW